MAERYEINHSGQIVVGESALCDDMDKMLTDLFSQYGWQCKLLEKAGACRKLELTDTTGKAKTFFVYCGTIRNEARNAYEKKIQLGTVSDPKKRNKENTIILGIYVYNSTDSYKDAIFVGYPIDDDIRYDTNPSIRGTFVNKILIQAKTEGFVYDPEHNSVAFRAEFVYYYLSNYYDIHYAKKTIRKMSDVEYEVANSSEPPENVGGGENIIFYGVPGCGKSFKIKAEYCKDDNYMERVVFHPDYTYSDFVGQILPVSVDDKISYPFIPGPFTRILKAAVNDSKHNYYLVIEEINRGNAPAIFGEIFQLLDRDNGISEYGISNRDIASNVYFDKDGKPLPDEKVRIPENLYILATMNTADQNVFTLDTAFKRRWKMVSIKNNISECSHAQDKICGVNVTWLEFANKINSKIIDVGEGNLGSEDNRLGAYFVRASDLSDISAFSEKVLMYLWNDAFKFDREKVFKSEYKTLEELIDGFKEYKFDVFVDEFGFDNSAVEFVSDEPIVAEGDAADQSADVYLAGKDSILVSLYQKLLTQVKVEIPDVRAYTTKGVNYIGFSATGIKKKNFADFTFKKGVIAISVEKPQSSQLIPFCQEIPYDGHHNHYNTLSLSKEQEIPLAVKIISESYKQLKEA